MTDLKYHVIWVTEYGYRIPARRHRGAGARPAEANLCGAGSDDCPGRRVPQSHPHVAGGASAELAPSKLVQFLKGQSSRLPQQEFPALRKRYSGQHCGRGCMTARAWARWTNKQSASISRTSGGTRTSTGSRSPRRRSLKPARQPGASRRLQPRPNFQSVMNLPPSAVVIFNSPRRPAHAASGLLLADCVSTQKAGVPLPAAPDQPRQHREEHGRVRESCTRVERERDDRLTERRRRKEPYRQAAMPVPLSRSRSSR